MTSARIIPVNQTYIDYMPNIQGIQDKATKAGFVYLIKVISGRHKGIYKIGYTESSNLKFRMSRMWDTDLVADFYIEYLIETDAPRSLEEKLHKTFRSKKSTYRREYFALANGDIKHILLIALETEFIPDKAKYRRLSNHDSTSMEFYLYGKFGTDSHSIVEVAYVLASTRMFLNIETINRMCGSIANKWSSGTIRRAIQRLVDLNYIDVDYTKKPREYKLNSLFWSDFQRRRDHDRLSVLYSMDVGIMKKNNSGYSMSVHLA